MIDFIAGCAMGAFITWAVRRVVGVTRRKRTSPALLNLAYTPVTFESDLGDSVTVRAYGGGGGPRGSVQPTASAPLDASPPKPLR